MTRYKDKGIEFDKNLLITGENREEVSTTNPLPVEVKNFDADVEVTNATGSAAIATSYAPVTIPFYFEGVTVHFDTAPTTAGSLTITLNTKDGSAYDTLLRSESMVGLTNFVFVPDSPILCEAGDAIDVAYSNPNSRTYGVRIIAREMS